VYIAIHGNSSQCTERHLPYGIKQCYLPLEFAKTGGTLFANPGGIESWADLQGWLVIYQDWSSVRRQTVAHPSSNHLIATRPRVEPSTSRS